MSAYLDLRAGSPYTLSPCVNIPLTSGTLSGTYDFHGSRTSCVIHGMPPYQARQSPRFAQLLRHRHFTANMEVHQDRRVPVRAA